ncbi:MAG: hypothetical protein JNJ54_34920 [Myxococcaceae bacterium]|nr:hypothetical protein [Myxococcaceae bacterium]
MAACCGSFVLVVVAMVVGVRYLRGGNSGAGGWQVIVSRWRSSCPACHQAIEPGVNILWKRGERARHADCSAAKATLEDQFLAETLDKLRDARGPASRANVLQAALLKVTEPPRRHRLLLEAARIGVQATLDKVDTLKGARAKRRHLEEALAQLRADQVPDEFQQEEEAWLSDAIKQLDEG